MNLLFLFLFAIYPPETAITGFPGEIITIPITIVGEDEIDISGTNVLSIQQEETIKGKQQTTITATINKKAAPGIHEEYIYFAPKTNNNIIPAVAQKVRVTVQTPKNEIIGGTKNTFKNTPWWPLALGGIMIMCVLFLSSVRFRLVDRQV